MQHHSRLADHWPLARIRVMAGHLELRLPTEDELFELIEVADAGVHDPQTMPFATAWTDVDRATMARNLLSWHWSNRASCSPGRWQLLLGVFLDGRIIGAQDVTARSFATLRAIESGSWLGARHQGLGHGTMMREAVLSLAFDGLDAQVAYSGAYVENAASQRVSEKCGYEDNGIHEVVRERGPRAPGGATFECALEQRYRLTRDRWRTRPDRPDVSVSGIDDDVRALLGV